MSTFVDQWSIWSSDCIDPAASPRTRTALRCAFYCGAISWASLYHKATTDKAVGDLTRGLMLENLWNELGIFVDEMVVHAAMKHADDEGAKK